MKNEIVRKEKNETPCYGGFSDCWEFDRYRQRKKRRAKIVKNALLICAALALTTMLVIMIVSSLT